MYLANYSTKPLRFSNAELKVQAIARRHAHNQLMRVSWARFRKAYEEYPRWEALALWIRALTTADNCVPSWLVAALREHCPDFVEQEVTAREPGLMSFRFLEWIQNRRFGYAKREGWLDALTFYGARHPRSEGTWEYWKHCEHEWSTKPPTSLPTFEKWWRAAMQWELCDGTNCLAVARAIETYVDWEALALWLRPLFATNSELSPQVVSELERRCPDNSRFVDLCLRGSHQDRTRILRHLARWGKNRFLKEAEEADGLDCFLERVRSYPWHVRIVAYGKHWRKERSWNRALTYPTFRHWQQAAGRYIKEDRN